MRFDHIDTHCIAIGYRFSRNMNIITCFGFSRAAYYNVIE